ncbi:uncharacterized protein [Haliotis cracherodii]|uniref:uncharacterized protein n=1 Tax=Haliotis cracherodii TaxID=6455 RepID=UPI0039E8F042
MIPLLLLTVAYLGASSAQRCGGVQNKYVCHPSNPRQFMICIGDQQYTMKCPGNLHFSTKTQTCDWPRNADCGRPVQVVTKPPPKRRPPQMSQRQFGGQRRRQPSYTWQSNKQGGNVNSAASKSRGEPVNAVAALTGPRKYKNPTDRERNVADDLYKKQHSYHDNKNQLKDTRTVDTNINQNRDKWTLAHYPWWAAKSATPANRSRMSRRPVTPTPGYRSGSPYTPRTSRTSRTSRISRTKTSRTSRTRYNPIRSSLGRVPVNSVASRHQPPPAKPLIKKTQLTKKKEVKKEPKPQRKIIRKPGKCDPTTCQLPDCRCIGSDIPGGVPVTQTPMMVMLTFDDSVNIANFDYYEKLFDGKFKNPNGCPVKGTFFVSGDATQYHLVEKLHKKGQEIASHSQSHRSPTTWWAHAGYDGYVHEIEGMRKKLSLKSKIPKDAIKGMRVPFLQIGGDDQYQMLHDYKYLYDTSMVTGHLYRNEKPPVWPFTLDYPPDSKTCSLTPCPQGSYPGLWEVPLVRWYGSNKMACAMPDGCIIGAGRKGTLKYLRDNFNRHYKTNRSPLGIFLHASWFRRKSGNFEALMDFLQELSRMEDVWVISTSQVVDWIRNPKPLSQVNNIESWKC